MDINTPGKYKIDWKKLKDSLVLGWDDSESQLFVNSKQIYTFNIISIKIPTSLYGDIKKKKLETICNINRRKRNGIYNL